MSSDAGFRCHIKRSERPCLVCSGHMDLIEARPSKLNIFGGIPFACSSEGVDCLDCPTCGFKTTTIDYEYLKMCKRSRQDSRMFTDSRNNHSTSDTGNTERERWTKRGSRNRHRESMSSHSGSHGFDRSCSSCHTPLESSSWQFCPKCGNRCSKETKQRQALATHGVPDVISEITIPKTLSKGLNDDDTSISKNTRYQIAPKSTDNELVRMVTPPKRASIRNCDMSGPVEMQY